MSLCFRFITLEKTQTPAALLPIATQPSGALQAAGWVLDQNRSSSFRASLITAP